MLIEVVSQERPCSHSYLAPGPVCESGDTFAKGRELVSQSAGDMVAFRSAGAYGAVMSSEYNTRPMIPEVLPIQLG